MPDLKPEEIRFGREAIADGRYSEAACLVWMQRARLEEFDEDLVIMVGQAVAAWNADWTAQQCVDGFIAEGADADDVIDAVLALEDAGLWPWRLCGNVRRSDLRRDWGLPPV